MNDVAFQERGEVSEIIRWVDKVWENMLREIKRCQKLTKKNPYECFLTIKILDHISTDQSRTLSLAFFLCWCGWYWIVGFVPSDFCVFHFNQTVDRVPFSHRKNHRLWECQHSLWALWTCYLCTVLYANRPRPHGGGGGLWGWKLNFHLERRLKLTSTP